MEGAKNMNMLKEEADYLNTSEISHSKCFSSITISRKRQEPEEYKWVWGKSNKRKTQKCKGPEPKILSDPPIGKRCS